MEWNGIFARLNVKFPQMMSVAKYLMRIVLILKSYTDTRADTHTKNKIYNDNCSNLKSWVFGSKIRAHIKCKLFVCLIWISVSFLYILLYCFLLYHFQPWCINRANIFHMIRFKCVCVIYVLLFFSFHFISCVCVYKNDSIAEYSSSIILFRICLCRRKTWP